MAPMVWTGLIVPPFRIRIRIQDQILGLGFRMDTRSTTRPCPPYPQLTGNLIVKEINQTNLASELSNLISSCSVWDPGDAVTDGTVGETVIFPSIFFFFFKEEQSLIRIQ